VLWLTAFVAVLFAGVEIGILIAVCATLGFVVVETLLSQMPELGIVPGKGRRAFRSLKQYKEDAKRVPGVRVFRIESPLIFFNSASITARLRSVVYGEDAANTTPDAGREVHSVVLDFSCVPYIDSSAVDCLTDLLSDFRHARVLLVITNPNSTVMHRLSVTPLLGLVNNQFAEQRSWVFLTVSEAIESIKLYEPPVPPVTVDVQDPSEVWANAGEFIDEPASHPQQQIGAGI